MKTHPTRAALTVALASLLGLSGCDLLNQTSAVTGLAPSVDASDLQLRYSPSLEQLGAHFCPKLIAGAEFVCTPLLGSAPAKSAMGFEFGIGLAVANPNEIPIPALDVLLGLTLFQASDTESLGSICVSMCGDDDPDCDGTPKADACTAGTGGGINDIGDFVSALPGLIDDIASGKALDELKKNTIAAGGDVRFDLAFTLGIDQALSVFEKLALPFVESLISGSKPTLDVPVSAKGAFFFNLPAVGRLGVDYGPLDSTWSLL